MAGNVKTQPDGYHTVTPYLMLDGAQKAIDFYTKAFGAQETFRIPGEPGKIGHAEIKIGDSAIMLADAPSGMPTTGAGSSFVLYFPDVDAVWKRALDAGAKESQPLEDKFYGDRMGSVTDPFGIGWSLATHIEDVSPEEMMSRGQAEAAKMAAAG